MKSLLDLIKGLVKATRDGKLKWEVSSPNSKGSYTVSLGKNYTVEVWGWTNEDNDLDGISAKLLDNGTDVDFVSGDAVSSNYFPLSELFETARRSAKNIDVVISDVEKYLNALNKN